MLAQLPEGWRADVPGSPCPYTPSWCASLLTRSLLAQDAAVAGLLSERGETVTITRAHHAVAEVVPARRQTCAPRLSGSLRPMTASPRTSKPLWP